jgi:outer membrane protein assembly factor BamB
MIQKLLSSLAITLCLAAPAVAQNVTTYHNGTGRHGAYTVPNLTTAAAATVKPLSGFSGAVTGNIYAQPLYWQPKGGTPEVIVATESNYVYALNATTGAVIWKSAQLAAPAISGLPCGNINPEGITGTPVIDPKTGTLYLDALTQSGSTFRQKLFALSLTNGTVLSGWPLDVQASLATKGITFSSANQGERSGLLLFDKQLYVVYGGKYGDCTPYNGTVIQVDPPTATLTSVWQTRASRGGIWAQGGIAADATSLYVTTGNTSGTSTYGDGESVIRLKPGLARSTSAADYYAPSNWLTLDNQDLDLGGTEALPVNLQVTGGKPSPRVIALGKDGNAYLLSRASLGGIGGPATVVKVSNNEIITGPAVYSVPNMDMVAFTNGNPVGCSTGGMMMLKLAPSGTSPVSVAWCAAYSGNGSPIITTTDGTLNPIVWVVGAEGDNELHAFNALTGAVLFNGTGTSMQNLRHFVTILAAGGNFYVASDNRIYAFTFTPG